MTKFAFLNKLNLDTDVISRLSLQLSSIEAGNSSALVSPLGKNVDTNTILSRWDSVFNSKSKTLSEDLKFIEQSNRSKYGPRSVSIPWVEREEGLAQSFAGEKIIKTISNAIELPSSHAMRPISQLSAVDFLKRNTNSGLPFYTRKGNVIDNKRVDYNALLSKEYPCILFTRTQELGKTRDVWGVPIADIVNEMRFYQPLLNYQRKLTWRSALSGPETVDLKMTSLINLCQTNDNYKMVSLDFSAYDTSVKRTLQNYAFDYIRGLFQRKYKAEILYIAHRFNTIGIVTPSGIMQGSHGVPSGSAFTNEVDSIVQFLCATSLHLSPNQFDIQGDDGAYVVEDPEELKERFRSQGLSVNDDKSYISERSFIYLQNLYSMDYSKNGIFCGIYPTYRALSRILFPERFDKFSEDGILGTDYYSIRTISILENCKHHPLFPELVEFVYKLDKTGLQFSQHGLKKYIKRITKTSGVEGILDYRYEDRVRGINSFETIKIISSL